MIGENIKTLRKTHDLTQPEFAKIIGISRNSLSRYENGTSSVSTELVDRICKKFNVSYLDIVGEEKMLTPVEDYQLTLKIEVIKERTSRLEALIKSSWLNLSNFIKPPPDDQLVLAHVQYHPNSHYIALLPQK